MRIPLLGFDVGIKRAAPKSQNKNWSPTDDRWYTNWPWMGSNGNTVATPETAMGNSALYSGVKVICETLGSIPLILYKRKSDDKRERASENSLYGVLKSLANPGLTAMEFREIMTAHMILRGNGFAQIIRSADNQVIGLYPLNPERMRLEWDKELSEYVYIYKKSDNKDYKFAREDIFHLRGPSEDGIWGKSFVAVLKYLIEHNLTLDEYSQNFYKNNAAPSGVLEAKDGYEVTEKARDRLRSEWKKKYSGANNSGSVAILEEGMQWKQIGMSSTDAQFIETLKDARKQILGCLRVQPYMVGDTEKLSFNTVEQLSIQFISYTMLPYFVRWEQTIYRDLLTPKERTKLFAEFLVDGLQRGDIVSRYRSYAIGRQWGWLSTNDIRRYENLDPIEGGDVYLQPLNMIDASEATDYLMSGNESSGEPGTKNELDDNSNPTLKNSKLHAILNQRRKQEQIHRSGDMNYVLEEMMKIALKVEEIRQNQGKTAENTPKETKKSSDLSGRISRMSEANVPLVSEIVGRVMRKESLARAKATQRQKLDTFDGDFFNEHKTFVRDSLAPLVRSQINQIFVLADEQNIDVVPAAANEVLDRAVEIYSSRYGSAGDKVEVLSVEFASELSVMVQEKSFKLLGVD